MILLTVQTILFVMPRASMTMMKMMMMMMMTMMMRRTMAKATEAGVVMVVVFLGRYV